MDNNNNLAPLLKALRRTRNQGYLTGGFLFVFGVAMLLGGLSIEKPSGDKTGIIVFGAILCAIGPAIFYILGLRNRDPMKSPFMRQAFMQPHRVVWVYQEIMASKAGGVTVKKHRTLKVATEDKRTHSVMVAKRDADAVMHIFQQQFPHATFGYASEHAKALRKAPNSLRRAA